MGESGWILVVDDEQENRAALCEILRTAVPVVQAADGYAALAKLFRSRLLPDLVLLDVAMPELDGFQVLQVMRSHPHTAAVPVIFLTAADAAESETRGLRLGAIDYITKPFLPEVVRLRVENCAELSRCRRRLEREVDKRVQELARLQENVIESLAQIIEYRDIDSGRHVRRTRQLVGRLISDMLRLPRFREELMAQDHASIVRASLLHDIGKIAIPDRLLLREGPLTDEEFELVKQHTVIGGRIMEHIMDGSSDAYYRHCRDCCLYHHERWDGAGYPAGLAGTEIPLSARILAVIDVYDALVSGRPYKKPIRHRQAVEQIVAGAGTQFDPDIAPLLACW